MNPLTLTPLPGIPFIRRGDDLAEIILHAISRARLNLEDGDIFVVAQKVVSRAEGRLVDLRTVTPSAEAEALAAKVEKDPRLVELILRESAEVLRAAPGVLIVEHKLGFVCANAGIDHSNVCGDDECVLLLPEDPDASADQLRRRLEEATGKRLGVLINDSHGRAWRLGTVGVAIGVSGVPALVDVRGRHDLVGRELRITQIGAADELAAAASLVMGQAAEGIPVVHARGFPYPLRESRLQELIRPKEKDLFR
ncbi:MAG: coenzyme F420-0:L-glutamate ligase [Chloroflexi bacterium]|nr:coenzyme F420-0:L-glutamate ligase [Chloroflexota bacterium]